REGTHNSVTREGGTREEIHSWTYCWPADTGRGRLSVHQDGKDADGGFGRHAAADGRKNRAYGAACPDVQRGAKGLSRPGGRGKPDAGRSSLRGKLRVLPWPARPEADQRSQGHVPAAAAALQQR